jgi:hypothetical protein
LTADKIKEVACDLQLDLNGLTVLTEAASGPYAVTPVIAAYAGARVIAFTRPTKYGTVDQITEQTKTLLSEAGVEAAKVDIVQNLLPEHFAQADIITNSGHLRPLSKEKLAHVKPDAVISLMYEAWEYRREDIDLPFIKEKGITIGATCERHPDVDVFNYLGYMAMKQLFDAGLSIYRNKLLLICNNDFGQYIAAVLSRNCAALGVIDLDQRKEKYAGLPIDWIGGFPNLHIPEKYASADAVVFTAYPFTDQWISEHGPISSNLLKSQVSDPLILRFAGDIDTQSLEKNGVRYFPDHVSSGHMGVLPSDIGFDPIIRLQAGGLKVGELLRKNETHFKGSLLVEKV